MNLKSSIYSGCGLQSQEQRQELEMRNAIEIYARIIFILSTEKKIIKLFYGT